MLRSIPNAASAILSNLQGRASQLGVTRQEESFTPRRLHCVSAPQTARARGGPCRACALRESAGRGRGGVAATQPETVASMQQSHCRWSGYLSLMFLVSGVSTKLELPGFLDIQ